jgi:hypothetical protein
MPSVSSTLLSGSRPSGWVTIEVRTFEAHGPATATGSLLYALANHTIPAAHPDAYEIQAQNLQNDTSSSTGCGCYEWFVSQVVFSSATASTCSVATSVVSLLAAGTCTIDADQAGNSDWAPAPQASQTVTVYPKGSAH